MPADGQSREFVMRMYAGREVSNRRRLNTQVTVAVEPPSPTDGSPSIDFADPDQKHPQPWKEGGGDESRRELLQRARSEPARRSRSVTDVADGPDSDHRRHHHHRHHHHRPRRPPLGSGDSESQDATRRGSKSQTERLLPTSTVADFDDADEADDDVPARTSSCRVYRVRSFTTKKGGSVVNRGDSIKICGGGGAGRRGSQLIITPANGSDQLLGGGLQQQPASGFRRRSVTSLTSGSGVSGSGSRLQPEVIGVGVSPHSRRHSFIIRQPSPGDAGAARRTSLRGNDRRSTTGQTDRGGVTYRVELTLGQNHLRRQSTERLSGTDTVTDQAAGRADDGGVDKTTGSAPNTVEEDDNNNEEEEEQDDDDNDENMQVYKVMVMGSHGVGKTTLVQQLLTSEYLANADDDQGQSVMTLVS